MTRTQYRLLLALVASLLLHLLPVLSAWLQQQPAPPPPPAPPLAARLAPPPMPEQPQLTLPEQPRPKATPPSPAKPEQGLKSPGKTAGWQDEIRRQLRKQQAQGLFYPPEAIAQGLEGEVLVLMIIGENGQVAAARIEQGSGHRLLDDAALRAVRSLRSLPADAPRETLLPVRFSLR